MVLSPRSILITPVRDLPVANETGLLNRLPGIVVYPRPEVHDRARALRLGKGASSIGKQSNIMQRLSFAFDKDLRGRFVEG